MAIKPLAWRVVKSNSAHAACDLFQRNNNQYQQMKNQYHQMKRVDKCSIEKSSKKKSQVASFPVEVLDPYTIRRVKVLPSSGVVASTINAHKETIRRWLNKGGFYKNGLIYRYQYHHEGVPRKTIVELVGLVVGVDSSSLSATSKRYYHPKEAAATLKAWLLSPEHINNPFPTQDEKKELMQQTGFDKTQLNNWFTNARDDGY